MNGDKIMFEINGHTKQLGIIGYPVEHTFSPIIRYGIASSSVPFGYNSLDC